MKKEQLWTIDLYNMTLSQDDAMLIFYGTWADVWRILAREFPDYMDRYEHLSINGKRYF